MVATLAGRGSVLTAADFASHRGEVQTPISTNYRGLDLVELPPNGQGLTALVLLNILEQFDLAALEPLGPDRFHLMLEAARMAYAVRNTHIADPAHMRVPVPALLDKAFAKKLAAKVARSRRVPLPLHRCRKRHRIHRRRPQPHGRVVHQFALFRLRRRHLRRRSGIMPTTAAPVSCSTRTIPMLSGPASGDA